MTRIAFTADLHCDDYGSKIDPATGLNARWVDTVDMARWVARDAQERGADLLVVGGDFTEARHPAPWRVAQIKAALAAFEGPQIFLRGNHDGIRDGRWIGDVLARGPIDSSFSAPGVDRLAAGVTVAAIPYLDAHWLRASAIDMAAASPGDVSLALGEAFLMIARGLYADAARNGGPVVLVVHQALAGGLMSDSQAAFLGDQGLVVDTRALAAIGYDAILAGHFHKHQVLSEAPLIAYSGSPYRTDFGEEHQPKGYLVVDIVPGGMPVMEFVETPARRFVTVDFDAPGWGDALTTIDGAIVRVVNVDPGHDVAELRRDLEESGAFEVTSITRRRVEREAAAGALAEGLTAHEAVQAYFEDDDDAEALVGRAFDVLAEVAA